jgi:hypothetical protein
MTQCSGTIKLFFNSKCLDTKHFRTYEQRKRILESWELFYEIKKDKGFILLIKNLEVEISEREYELLLRFDVLFPLYSNKNFVL